MWFVVLLAGCGHIQPGASLSGADISRIKKLGLLDSGEHIVSFYSEATNAQAGNFFTDRRLAKYWIDNNNPSKNYITFAWYDDVKSIDTVYYAGLTWSPYMLVTMNNNTNFKVCGGGRKDELKMYFEEAIAIWRSHTNNSPKQKVTDVH